MNQNLKKLLSANILFNHVVLAVFCCIVFFEMNMLINNTRSWYLGISFLWLILLSVHLILFLLNRKKR